MKNVGISSSIIFYNNFFKKYEDIINAIYSKQDIDGLSRISQKEIAEILNVSSATISKSIRRLERSDKCIEKIKPGVYQINHMNIYISMVLIYILKVCPSYFS